MSIFNEITSYILDSLENGCVPWHKPWKTSMPMNLVGKEYRGVNLLLLAMSPHASPYWLTYRQAQKLKGHVKRGEKGTRIVFWGVRKVREENESKEKSIPYMKSYVVFNLDQCEDIPAPESDKPRIEPLEVCESLIQGMPSRPTIEYSGNVACYIPKQDIIRMPHRDAFESAEEYYSTLFHEAVHSTGHVSRLNRKGIENVSPFGSESYSKEELVAELGASFLCGITGIEGQTIENNAAYINGWLKELKSDKRLILTAASQAQKAVDYIRGNNHETDN